MKKKVRENKNNLRKRAYHIIMSDRNDDEIKRTNQKTSALNASFDNLHKCFKQVNISVNKAINSINNIIRSHLDTIL